MQACKDGSDPRLGRARGLHRRQADKWLQQHSNRRDVHRTVHTGPNSQLGGVYLGFLRVLYHLQSTTYFKKAAYKPVFLCWYGSAKIVRC